MQTLAVRPGMPALAEPVLGASLAQDSEVASKYFVEIENLLATSKTVDAAALRAQALSIKEKFFRRHAVALYDEATDRGARFLRVGELLMAVAGRYPALLPNREQIDDERALMRQSAKRGPADQRGSCCHE